MAKLQDVMKAVETLADIDERLKRAVQRREELGNELRMINDEIPALREERATAKQALETILQVLES